MIKLGSEICVKAIWGYDSYCLNAPKDGILRNKEDKVLTFNTITKAIRYLQKNIWKKI